MIYQIRKEKFNIILRPFLLDDITPAYLDWFADEETTRYTSHGAFPYFRDDAISYWKKRLKDKSQITWAIITTPIISGHSLLNGPLMQWTPRDEHHIGNVTLQQIDLINRSAEIAWIIGEKKWRGKGIATEVGKMVISHGFKKLNLHRIWAGMRKDNTAMLHVAEKLGMSLEGTLRHQFSGHIDGLIMAILREMNDK